VTHALDWYEDQGERFNEVCLLQVTSPLRTAADIEAALSRFRTTDADSLVSVSKYDTPPQVALVVEDGFLVEKYDPPSVFSDEYLRSQDVDDPVHANGAIYVTTTDVWRREETFYTDRTVGYEMPPERSIDVDEPWHLDLVDALLSRRHNS
jgi:N-acylneuraminate cytidylyltransferase